MRVLTKRELNRALLARQLLLERRRMPAAKAVARLAGLQAEDNESPYVALHARLDTFRRAALEKAVVDGAVVRTPAMRSTLHMLTGPDYRTGAEALRAAHMKAYHGYFKPHLRPKRPEKIVDEARRLLTEQPRTFAELRELLAPIEPTLDPRAISWTVRAYLPVVNVPPGGMWRFRSAPSYTLAQEPFTPAPEGARYLVLAYLRAFGPASRPDVAAWSGIPAVKDTIDALASELRTFRDEGGTVLNDIKRGLLPGADAPAPPRLAARADNLILSHADRTRVLPKAYASPVIRMGRMRATFLIDGMVAGIWTVKRAKSGAELTLQPFDGVPRRAREGLLEDADRMLRFVADDTDRHTVRIGSAPD